MAENEQFLIYGHVAAGRSGLAVNCLMEAMEVAACECSGFRFVASQSGDANPEFTEKVQIQAHQLHGMLCKSFPKHPPVPIVALLYDVTETEAASMVEAGRVAWLRSIPYDFYLKTDHWLALRARLVKAAGHRCRLCNAGNVTLNVHHRTYERRGCEIDDDLTVLCATCHERFHQESGVVRPE
jgi:hypothetical protein